MFTMTLTIEQEFELDTYLKSLHFFFLSCWHSDFWFLDRVGLSWFLEMAGLSWFRVRRFLDRAGLSGFWGLLARSCRLAICPEVSCHLWQVCRVALDAETSTDVHCRCPLHNLPGLIFMLLDIVENLLGCRLRTCWFVDYLAFIHPDPQVLRRMLLANGDRKTVKKHYQLQDSC